MPATKRPEPIYSRGKYRLYARAGRNHEIVWYDDERKRERSISAGTKDDAEGREALDRQYLKDGGHDLCPTCHRPWIVESPYLSRAIIDYLIKQEGRAGYRATSSRLNQAITYIAETGSTIRCAQVDPDWIKRYRKWLSERPIFNRKGERIGTYSIGYQESCIRQLAAAINATPGQEAQFKAEQAKDVSNSPTFRASVKRMADMFNYCLRPEGRTEKEREMVRRSRTNLLRYLRMAVATWARPDAIYEVTARQWFSEARVLDLNPPGRRQTKKYRPKVPIAKQYAPFFDSGDAYLTVSTVDDIWRKMRIKLGLPGDRQAGVKLIRRSMATLVRKRIGEERWKQGQMMLGHVKYSTSDIYAIPDPANLGLALRATESIIDEIEKLAPGAFYRNVTANGRALKVVKGGVSD
jgi:hypothetical protein